MSNKKLVNKITSVGLSVTMAVWLSGATMIVPVVSAQTIDLNALLLQLQQIQSQLTALQQQQGVPVTPPTTAYNFTRNLTVGSRGEDVKALQKFLNASGFKIAERGPGSPGNESTYFGNLTKAALAKWQAAQKISPANGYFGPSSRAKYAALVATTPVTPNVPVLAPGLTVKLDGPAAGTIIAGQAIATLSHFVFQNGDEVERKVTNLVFTRTGISSDSILKNVYLYDGVRRLTDAAVVSAGKVTFNNPAGLFTIPAKSSRTISVRADILSGTSGQTVGIALQSLADVVSDASGVGGVFPLNGNAMTVATADLATVSVGPTNISSGNVDAGTTDYIVWKSNLTLGTRDVILSSLQLRQIGSVKTGDLQNFRLFVKGVERGAKVNTLASDNTVTFDLSANPVKLTAGSAQIEVRADIIGGANRNFSFSLKRAGDLDVRDAEFGANVLATGNFPVDTGQIDINRGSLTVNLSSDSPSGDIVYNGTDVILAKYTLTAFGEAVKIENLKVDLAGSTFNETNDKVTLRNGRLLANGVQVGSTAGIVADSGTTFELGSALIVRPGTPVSLEIRADIFDSEGTNGVANGNAIKVRLMAGSNNAQRTESDSYFNVPGSNISGNTLRVTIGLLTLQRNAAYGNQTVVAGQAIKIGSFNLRSTAAETINISNYVVSVTGTVGLTELSNLKISESATVKPQVASGDNSFSVSQSIAPNTTKTIDIFADVSTAVTSGTIISRLKITATGALTGEDASVSQPVSGQTITISPSSLSVTLAPATAESGIVVGGTNNIPFATYRFNATNEAFTVTEAVITVTNPNSLQALTLGDKTVSIVGTTAVFSNLNLSVPKGGSGLDVPVTANWNIVEPGAGVSGATSTATLSAFKARGVQSSVLLDVSATSPTDGILTRSSSTLSGGVNAVAATRATGTITVSGTSTATGAVTFVIGNVTYTTNSINSGSGASAIATVISETINNTPGANASSTFVPNGGAVVNVTALTPGAGGNLTMMITGGLPGVGFTVVGLSGGTNAISAVPATGTVTVNGTWKAYDRATVRINNNPNTHTVQPGATTPDAIATALANLIANSSSTNGATATSTGNVIILTATTTGAHGNSITLETSATGPGADVAANTMTLRKTIPTVSSAAGDTTLAGGQKTLMKVTIAANAAEDVELNKLTFRIVTGVTTTLEASNKIQVKLGDTVLGEQAVTQNPNSSSTVSVDVSQHRDRFIPKGSSRTFDVVATEIGVGATGSTNLIVQLLGDASAGSSGNFIWRDGSGIGINGFQVKTLPSSSFTLTRN